MSISHTAHVTLNEPSDQIDLEAWLFGLSDSDYQACAKGHRGAGVFTDEQGRRMIRQFVRARTWPMITCFDDRWRWLVASIIPRFRRFDADVCLVDGSLRRILTKRATTRRTPASYRVRRRRKSPCSQRYEMGRVDRAPAGLR